MTTISQLPQRMKRLASRPQVRRGGVLAALLALIIFVPALTMAPVAPDWAPPPLQHWAFDMRLLIGRPLTTFSSLAQAVQTQPRLFVPTTGERVTVQSDGLEIAGTLYGLDAETADPEPAILLLHGSTPEGRKLGLYRVMGKRLADLGYVVLTIDQRGYGQSDNPPDLGDPDSFDFVEDAEAALAFLAGLDGVDTARIYLVGHSFGGDVAATAVANGADVDRLVLIGPGRNFMLRGGSPQADEFDYFRRREQRYMYLWQAIAPDVFVAYRAPLPLENHTDYFDAAGHIPTLLLDGELESASDQQFLAEIYDEMDGEKAYETLADADHYANVANVGPLIVYGETAVSQLITEIDTFLQSE